MNRFQRYAAYYMPDPAGEFWALASSWLGRDAFTDRALDRPVLPALEGLNLERLTAGPRHYGFHATLKAPFEPAGIDAETSLLSAMEAVAYAHAPFTVHLEVAPIGEFMALRLAEEAPAMDALHEDCVRQLDTLRAPLSEADLARRRQARLTPLQDLYLVEWGYPYIFQQFRFHMTLTSRIASYSAKETIREALTDLFVPITSLPHRVEGVALFGQIDRQAPFQVIDWFALRGKASTGLHDPGSVSTA